MARISTNKNAQGACIIITAALAPTTQWRTVHFKEEIPIYYTWVKRVNCG